MPATKTFENQIAFWFSMALCDPNSYPQNPCTQGSDKNTGSGFPTDAGSAFLEMQFYPPGFFPFITQISCDKTHWCASLHINSAECTFGFAFCNPNCTEPTNFSFHPEYNTSKFDNFVPWAALQANVGFAVETGHFIPGANGDKDADDAPCFPGPTLAGCTVPPLGAVFYPFYAQSGKGVNCNFTFGNDIRGATINDFGRDVEYGTPNLPWCFGTASGGIRPNPCTPHA